MFVGLMLRWCLYEKVDSLSLWYVVRPRTPTTHLQCKPKKPIMGWPARKMTPPFACRQQTAGRRSRDLNLADLTSSSSLTLTGTASSSGYVPVIR